MLIGLLIVGLLLMLAGILMINRATSPDAAASGFGMVFFGAVALAFALLVIFVSRAHGIA